MGKLAGRDTYLARLEELLGAACAGRGGVAVLVAEGGGGKTALLDAFVELARERATAAWGDALDGEGTPPLWPWTQILRAIAADPARAERANAAIGALSSATDEPARFAAFDLTAQLLTSGGPIVVVIDDLHWADGASLRLLEFVAPMARRAPLMVVVATRPTGSALLETTLGMLLRRNAVRLDLRPLTASEVGEQLAAAGAPATVANEVLRLSGGNPLFVQELARHLAGGASLAVSPGSLAGVLRAEVARLSKENQGLLAACAVIDGSIVPALARAAAAAPAASFDALVAAGMLVSDADEFRFRHDVIREAIRASLSESERRAIDAALAAAAGAAGERTLVAVHGCRADAAWDAQRAHAAAVAERDAAIAKYAVESAVAFTQLARRVRALLSLTPDELLPLLVRDGEAFTSAGLLDEGRVAFREAGAAARAIGDATTLARIALVFGLGHEYGTAHDREVVELLREALAALEPGEHALRARVLARLAWQELQAGQTETRLTLSSEAVREARMAEDAGALAAALNAHCWGLGAPNQLVARTAAANEAVAAARDAADIDLELGALMWCFRCELESGRVAAARKAAEQFDAITRRSPLPYHRWYAPLFLGTLALIEGRLEDAQAFANEIDPAATAQETMAHVNRTALVGDILVARGGESMAEGLRMTRQMLDETMGIGWMIEASALSAAGDIAGARASLDANVPRIVAAVDEDWFVALSGMAVAAVMTASADHARTIFGLLEPYADHWVVVGNGGSCHGPIASFLSILAATAGMPDEAERYRSAALATIAENGAQGMAFWLDITPLGSAAGARPGGLSAREAEVLALLARGHSNQEIADALVLSVRTVQRHIENAYGRLGVHNRAGATLEAVRLGLVAASDVRPAAG